MRLCRCCPDGTVVCGQQVHLNSGKIHSTLIISTCSDYKGCSNTTTIKREKVIFNNHNFNSWTTQFHFPLEPSKDELNLTSNDNYAIFSSTFFLCTIPSPSIYRTSKADHHNTFPYSRGTLTGDPMSCQTRIKPGRFAFLIFPFGDVCRHLKARGAKKKKRSLHVQSLLAKDPECYRRGISCPLVVST